MLSLLVCWSVLPVNVGLGIIVTVKMDIQNCSTPPKRIRFETPKRSNKENQPFCTPPKQAFETPKREESHHKKIENSSRRPLGKRSNLTLTASAKPKENPQSKHRQRETSLIEREEFQISMFTLTRLDQDYQLVHMLGQGNFSQVGLYQSRMSKELFAIKQTRANRMSINQAQALGSLWALVEQSPNVVRYFHSWIEEGELYLVMEYCDDSLSKMIERHRNAQKPFDQKSIKKIMKAALLGIECLHKCGILHLDLKPENMLLHGDILKIADFGLSRAATRTRSGDIQEGDSRYLAREMLNVTSEVDLTKADVFSLAMTLFEMLTLERLPNNGPEWLSIRENGLSLVDRMDMTGYSKDLLQLIQKMGSKDWFNRPSAFQCLHHRYLKQSARVSHLLAGGRSSKKRDSSM